MKDIIYRDDAIKAIQKDPMGGLNYEGILNRLPSVEPEQYKLSHELLHSFCIQCKYQYTFWLDQPCRKCIRSNHVNGDYYERKTDE